MELSPGAIRFEGTLQSDARRKIDQTVADVDTKRQAAQSRLEARGKASSDAWQHLKQSTQAAWDEFEEAVKKAASEFEGRVRWSGTHARGRGRGCCLPPKCPGYQRAAMEVTERAVIHTAPVIHRKVCCTEAEKYPCCGALAVKYLAAIVFAVVALVAGAAFAQPSADAKARGKFDFYGRGARSAMQGARASAGSYREFIRSTQPVPAPIVSGEVVVRESPGVVVVSPQIAQAATDEIGDYIVKSEKHLAWMRRQAEMQKDQQTLASLDSIDRNLAVAKRNHAALCTSCLDDNVDASAAMACCQAIDEALAKAISEHDVLMKRVEEKQSGGK